MCTIAGLSDTSPGDRQRLLLPPAVPALPSLGIAAYYRTSQAAGGDYYDFFALPRGRLGILIADVSGHGEEAAALMAVTHRLAHDLPGLPEPPDRLSGAERAARRPAYVPDRDVCHRVLWHLRSRRDAADLRPRRPQPAPVAPGRGWRHHRARRRGPVPAGTDRRPRISDDPPGAQPGDQLVFFTDGITEATDPRAGRAMFGVEQLDAVLAPGHVTPGAFLRGAARRARGLHRRPAHRRRPDPRRRLGRRARPLAPASALSRCLLHNLGERDADLGQAIVVVLALPARGDGPRRRKHGPGDGSPRLAWLSCSQRAPTCRSPRRASGPLAGAWGR